MGTDIGFSSRARYFVFSDCRKIWLLSDAGGQVYRDFEGGQVYRDFEERRQVQKIKKWVSYIDDIVKKKIHQIIGIIL